MSTHGSHSFLTITPFSFSHKHEFSGLHFSQHQILNIFKYIFAKFSSENQRFLHFDSSFYPYMLYLCFMFIAQVIKPKAIHIFIYNLNQF